MNSKPLDSLLSPYTCVRHFLQQISTYNLYERFLLSQNSVQPGLKFDVYSIAYEKSTKDRNMPFIVIFRDFSGEYEFF